MTNCFRLLLMFAVAAAFSLATESSSTAQGWLNQVKKAGGKISNSVKTEASNFNRSVSKIAPNGISTGKISPFSSGQTYSHLGPSDASNWSANNKPIGINPYAGNSQSVAKPQATSFAEMQRQLKVQQQITAEKQRQATIAMNQKNVQLIGQSIQAIGQIAQRNQIRREREQLEQQRAAFQQQQQQFIQNQNPGYQQQGYAQPMYQQQVVQPQQMQYRQPQQQVVQQQVRRPVFGQSQPVVQQGQVIYRGQPQPRVAQQGYVQQGYVAPQQHRVIQQGARVFQSQPQAYQQQSGGFFRR